jgi:hypothetical protein
LDSVSFPDARHGWVVGTETAWAGSAVGSIILTTSDDGATWTPQDAGTTAQLDDVCFPDPHHGWAVGGNASGGVILATTNGGTTWTARSSGTVSELCGVAFPDARHGWVVGDNGTILATSTGGWPDRTPTTTVSGADDHWHNAAVTLTFSATDNAGGPGVRRTLYKIGSGLWKTGTSVTIPAPANHTNDGRHTVSYRSIDNAGNVEAMHTCTVKIDTRGPTTQAPRPSTVVRGFWPVFSYRADDQLSPRADISIRITDQTGRTRHLIALGWQLTNQTYRTGMLVWRCRLPRGTYRYTVLATDLAGNRQTQAGSNKLIVK